MIVFDGEKWTIPKYKITRAVVVYDDQPELYPDGVAEEVILDADQESRLEEIRYNTDMSMDQVEDYVIYGIGTPPDNRTDIDKLIDLIPEPTEEVMKIVDEWKPDTRYQKGHYLKHRGTLYKVLQSHMSQSDWTPDLAPSLFVTLLTSPTGEILPWVQPGSENYYRLGDKVTHNGKVWESMVDVNTWEPGAPGVDERIWREVV